MMEEVHLLIAVVGIVTILEHSGKYSGFKINEYFLRIHPSQGYNSTCIKGNVALGMIDDCSGNCLPSLCL